jgi:hypothetical protein
MLDNVVPARDRLETSNGVRTVPDTDWFVYFRICAQVRAP